MLPPVGVQYPQAAQQQAVQKQPCAMDDGDFERMMARFDELERQEASTQDAAAGMMNVA